MLITEINANKDRDNEDEDEEQGKGEDEEEETEILFTDGRLNRRLTGEDDASRSTAEKLLPA